MHGGFDAATRQLALKFVAGNVQDLRIETNCKEIERVGGPWDNSRSLDAGKASQSTTEEDGVSLALRNRSRELGQLHNAERSCCIRQAKIKTQANVVISLFLSVRAEQPEFGSEQGIGGGEHATFARRHVLRRVEGVADDIGKRAHVSSSEPGTMSLCGIPDQPKIMAPGELREARDIGRVPEEVNRRESARTMGNPFLDGGGIEREGLGVNVRQDRDRSSCQHHRCGGHEGEVGDDHFVAGFEQSPIGDIERSCSRVDCDRKARFDSAGEALLKVRGNPSRTQLAAFENSSDRLDLAVPQSHGGNWNRSYRAASWGCNPSGNNKRLANGRQWK